MSQSYASFDGETIRAKVMLHCACGERSEHAPLAGWEMRCSQCGRLWTLMQSEADVVLVRED